MRFQLFKPEIIAMKKHFTLSILTVVFACAACTCSAQKEKPAWVSDKGYWVLESNVNNPKSNIVYFYNLAHVLVYKEKVEGVKIKLKKTKILLHLKEVLEQSIANWEVRHVTNENEMLVAAALKE